MKKIVLILITLILIISGCTTQKGPSVSITERDIRVGTDGLVIEFNKNMPPQQVYESEIFPVGIKLSNKGAFDIVGGYLLLNIEKDILDFQKGSEKVNIKIDGKSLGNPQGGYEIKNYLLKPRMFGGETETITSVMIATACYNYKTFFTESVCVDTDFYNARGWKKACSASDASFGSGQGAPVAVTKIEPKMFEENGILKPMFIIHIKNVGKGQVIDSTKVADMCSAKGISREDINTMNLTANLGDEKKALVCNPSVLKLKDKEEEVRCTFETGIDKEVQPYTTILGVELDYGYTESVSKSVEIRKVI